MQSLGESIKNIVKLGFFCDNFATIKYLLLNNFFFLQFHQYSDIYTSKLT